MIVPGDDEDMQYFDDDLRSFSFSSREMGEMSEEEEVMEKVLKLHSMDKELHPEESITNDGFSGFRSLNDFKGVSHDAETTREMAGGDCNENVIEIEKNESFIDRDVDVFGRSTAKGRGNWFTSEYGSVFRLMDGELLPREYAKPARKATSDIKYIKQLYTGDVSLSELSVGEDTKRIGWGSFFKGDPDTWNVWNSESELPSLTTLDVQRNVAAAVNSRRKMKWAIGVEKNGMVTGVQMNEDEKDILRQAIDFSLSREFVPELDPRIVKLELVRVSAVTGNRFLVLITIKSLVESLHQLSSGRIFYLVGDRVVMAESINQIRLALEERMKHDDRVREQGLGQKGSSMAKWSALVVGLTLSLGALYASKKWIK
ncbi:hypothetical protein PMAYCL1PPCAC_02171 [Pristionchus mayeri]|uniref:Uncharacterized protein n=1 Tax=Pristionchus mayeri TaxID=1317129 RepID=A0AAN4Z3N0_9BILA|nr:hypothetical protein PMAYCL1PPCAC_02171 [Pristionchus mayeri]